MKATCGSITDRGLNPRRPENQDNLLVWPERGLYLVADGVGGRQGGATASALVVEVFERVFSQEMDGSLTESLGELLEKTIAHCNEKIYFDAQQTPSLKGMATTIAAVAVEGRRAVVAHVGDSRVYRFDAHGLIQLTEDHTDVNEAVRTGRLSREEATHHPRRHVLNRALGAEAEVEVEQIEIELDEQTSLLLCTDGITIHLDEEELEQILQSRHPPQVICEQLRERCYLAGAEDNLTVILVDFGERLYSESEDEEEGAALAASPARREIVEAEDATDEGGPFVDEAEEEEEAAEGPGVGVWQGPESPARSAGGAASGRPISRVFEVDLTAGAGTEREDPDAELAREMAGEMVDTPSRWGPLVSRWNGLVDRLPWRTFDAVPESPAPPYDRRSVPGVEAAFGGDAPRGSGQISWLFVGIALVVGLLLGSLLAEPVGDLLALWSRPGLPWQEAGIGHLPKDPEVRAAYARHLEGGTEEARQRLDGLLAVTPTNAEASFYLGLIDYDQEKFEEAATRIHFAARLDPSLPDIRVWLAMAYLSTGQLRTARDLLDQVVRPGASRSRGRATTPTPIPTPTGSQSGGAQPAPANPAPSTIKPAERPVG